MQQVKPWGWMNTICSYFKRIYEWPSWFWGEIWVHGCSTRHVADFSTSRGWIFTLLEKKVPKLVLPGPSTFDCPITWPQSTNPICAAAAWGGAYPSELSSGQSGSSPGMVPQIWQNRWKLAPKCVNMLTLSMNIRYWETRTPKWRDKD